MKKLNKWIAILACMAFLMTAWATPVTADFQKVDGSTIVMTNKMHNGDFLQFLKLTKDEWREHYTIIIHSPGGDAFSCVAVINRIAEMKRAGVKFTTKAYGLAASAGTYIFMMGDERVAYEGNQFLFHSIEAQLKAHWYRVSDRDKRLIRNLDSHIAKMIKRQTGWTDRVIDYWLNGGKAQWMRAKTAYLTGFATEYVETN